MNNDHGSQNNSDLEPSLMKAVEAVLIETVPDDAISRVMDRAKRLKVGTSDRSSVGNERAAITLRHSRRWFPAWHTAGATAIAAALLFVLFLLSGSTSVSFAEMLAALATRPWIHATTTYSDGQRSVTSESWVWTAHRCAAMRFDDQRQFDDFESEVSLQYNAKEGTIFRVPYVRLRENSSSLAQLPGLLDTFISDKANAHDLFYGERVIKTERHEEKQLGKQWLVYLIHLERIGNSSLNRTVRIRLDKATQLPESWEERKANGDIAMTRFDYPDSGPRNIYELGVPKTAKLIDRVPKDDLARMVAAQRADRKQFDRYDAIVVQYTEGVKTNYNHFIGQGVSVKRVRRQEGRYRVDQLLIAKEGLSVPEAGTDMQLWWKENRDKYLSVPQLICDENSIHFYKMLDDHFVPGSVPNLTVVEYSHVPIRLPMDDSPVDWPQLMPEQCSRPYLGTSDKTRRFDVDAAAKDGPEGTVRVIVTRKSELHSDELSRYWFDPDRDFVLRKEISSVFDRNTNQLKVLDTQEYEEFAQSPSGKWFPQLVRRTTSDKPVWHGETRFFVDFSIEMDADLFRPVSEK